MLQHLRLALIFSVFFLLAGCIPSRVMIDLAPADGELAESAVIEDEGATGSSPKIALIDVTGLISHVPPPGLIEGRANTVDRLVARIDRAAEDDEVRGVVLRINSPGGTVAASQSVYEEVVAFRARTGKPVVVSMADVAASGGYHLALAGDHIMAQSASITGSVGVLMQTFNLSRGMDMIGVEGRTLTSRPNKDLANPFEPAEAEHYAILQGMVDGFYDDFRDLVVASRPGIPEGRMDEVLDGRAFTGRQALELALVDELGSLRDAYERAKAMAGVERARLVKYHAEGRVLTTPYASARLPGGGEPAGAGAEVNLIQLNLNGPLGDSPGFYYLWRP